MRTPPLFALALLAVAGTFGCESGPLTGPEARSTFAIMNAAADTSRLDGLVFLLDGRRVSAARVRALDPRTIESIEVVRGPAAQERYGPDAAQGAILVTLTPARR